MKNLLIFGFIMLIMNSCSSFNNKEIESASIDSLLFHGFDTTRFAIIRYDSTYYSVFNNDKPAKFTVTDFLLAESILKSAVIENNIDLKRYKRQYVAVINNKGEKEIWINFFCNDWYMDWKKEIIIVKDGGDCFFNLKINLTTRKYYDLMINGEA
jgi:hypothetical protein